MKKHFAFYFIILPLLFCSTLLRAQTGTSINSSIDAGTMNSCTPSTYTDQRNNSAANGYSNTYGQPSPEVWYRFLITSSMQVNISLCGSSFDTYLHLLNSAGGPMYSNDDNGPLCSGTSSSIQQTLPPGLYYIAVEGYSNSTGNFQLSIQTPGGGSIPVGANMSNAIDVGTLNPLSPFYDSRSNGDGCLGNDYGQPSTDIFYKFTLTNESTVRLSHCGSSFDTYMHLLDVNGNLIVSNDDNGPLCSGTASSIKRTLPAGIYYLVSEGYGGGTGIINTSISMELPGSLFSNAINAGTLKPGDFFSSTLNNSPPAGYGNEMGQPSDDIFYKFTINTPTQTEVSISHCGSTFDTYLHLLDENGNTIATNDDNGPLCSGAQASMRLLLGSGTYYVVSEGYNSNAGDIITQISIGQSAGWNNVDQNYVRIRIPRTGINDYSALENSSSNKDLVQTSTQYFDGLGRLIQTVQRQASPQGMDLVQAVMYDGRGQEYRKYLPYSSNTTDGAFKLGNPEQNVKAFYNPASPGASAIALTSYPYADAILEKSKLSRILEQGAAGETWQPTSSGATGGGHVVKTALAPNDNSEIKLWVISGNSCTTTANYDAYQFTKKTITDENGNRSIEYRNKSDQVILKRSEYESGNFANTHYIYDDFNNLRYVIPPGFTATSFNETDPAFDQFIYAYHYDDQNRLVEKKIPGKGWEYLVYNQLDQVIFTQNATQRANGKWFFNRYDGVARVVMTGEYVNNESRVTLQSLANQYTGGAYETYTGAGVQGYSLNTLPQTAYTILTVNYYGTYNIPGIGAGFNASVPISNNVNGMVTGSKVGVLGTSTLLLTVNYYDAYGHLKEAVAQNHKGGIDRIVNSYSFAGELTGFNRTHQTPTANVTIAIRTTYDHVGRKKQSFEQINTSPEVKIIESLYNEIGQVISKSRHNNLQTSTYSYNPRGWFKAVNSSVFSMELKYEDGTTPQYNGNIANQLWGDASLTNNFTYAYDKQNRLLSGNSTGIVMAESFTYDIMGNVATLIRDGMSPGIYNYTGNRLNNISGGITTATYGYDLEGNTTTDGRTGTTLVYNILNLPQTITKAGLSITYTYAATGAKLQKISNGVTRDYIDGIEYNGNAIDIIHTEEGLARNNGGTFSYEYNLTDHLGNVRRSFYQNPVSGALNVIQKDDYYPFGQRKTTIAGQNKYLYNGKELQEELGQLDYGARFYDPVIGRFSTIDPMSEITRRFSPYHYGANNPIRFIDVDGMFYGDFFLENGTYLGSDGKEDEKVYSVKNDGVIKTVKEGGKVISIIDHSKVTDLTEKYGITYSQFKDLAGTVYTEMSKKSTIWEEGAGIYSVLENRATLKGKSTWEIAQLGGIYGWAHRNDINKKGADATKAQAAYRGLIAGIANTKDYSNGAYFWQGVDFHKHFKNMHAYESFYLVGFKFTDPNHDIWEIGDHKSGKKGYDYMYESTEAKGKTTFLKYNDQYQTSERHPKEWP